MLSVVAALAKFAPVIAPVVKDVATGIVRGLTKQSPSDLPGMADQFSRISEDFLSRLTHRTELPGALPAIAPGGCIPSPERHPWKLPVVFPPATPNGLLLDRLMARVDRLLESLGRVMDLLKDLLAQGPKALSDKPPSPGGLYTEMARGESPTRPSEGSALPGSVPNPGIGKVDSSAPPVQGGPKGAAPVSSEGLGGRTLERLFDDMNGVESQINGLDPNDPKAQFRLLQLQQKMQRITQMINLITEMRKALHDMSMAIIRNIR